MKEELDILSKIEHVNAPSFLFTRIEAKLRTQVNDYLSTKKTMLYLSGIAAIVIVNICVISVTRKEAAKAENLAAEMELVETNQLYE